MKTDSTDNAANENISDRTVTLTKLDQLAQEARSKYESGVIDAAGLAEALNVINEVRAAVATGDRARFEAVKR